MFGQTERNSQQRGPHIHLQLQLKSSSSLYKKLKFESIEAFERSYNKAIEDKTKVMHFHSCAI